MNEERVNRLVKAIEAYEDREHLFTMTPEEATRELNANGHDFTVDEMVAMGEAIVSVAKMSIENGELEMNELEQVAGGGAVASILLQGAATLCTWGAALCLYLAW